jgi:hypothetical protein
MNIEKISGYAIKNTGSSIMSYFNPAVLILSGVFPIPYRYLPETF